MKDRTYKGELKVGMRVYIPTVESEGTVYFVDNQNSKATIKLDNGSKGGGVSITEEPYNGTRGWYVSRRSDGCWSSSLELVGINNWKRVIVR